MTKLTQHLLLLLLLGFPLLVHADITTNLVGHWNIEAGSGTSVADTSGNGLNLTCVNTPTWVAGRIGTWALNFVATSSQQCNVSITTASPLWPNTGNFTVAAWVKRASNSAAQGILGNWNSGGRYWYFQLGSSDLVELRVTADSAATLTSTGTITNTNWRHVAVSVVRGGAATFYIDGAASGTPSIAGVAGTINQSGTLPFCLGCIGNTSASQFMNGSIDDAYVFTRALSAGDIAELMAVTATAAGKRRPLFLQ